MKTKAITMRARNDPTKNCAYCQFSEQAVAGTAMMVTALISVATKESMAAHQGMRRPPRKKSRVSFSSLPK